jgi:hypothetical protein
VPYIYRVTGLTADLRGLDETAGHDAATLIDALESDDCDLSSLEETLATLAAMSPTVEVALTAKGEEGDAITLRVRAGQVTRTAGADPAVEDEWSVEVAPAGPLHSSLDEVKQLGRKRAAAPVDRVLALLRGASGDSALARSVRREAYGALSWIETEPVREVLLAGLRSEPDEVASTIVYVLWRQDQLIADLPQLIEAARADDDKTLVHRLIQAQHSASR